MRLRGSGGEVRQGVRVSAVLGHRAESGGVYEGVVRVRWIWRHGGMKKVKTTEINEPAARLLACKLCAISFEPKRRAQMYCSRHCSLRRERKKIERPQLTCAKCGDQYFRMRLDAVKKQKYCSQSCASAASPRDASKMVSGLWADGKYKGSKVESGQGNCKAKWWRFRDDRGRIHEFKNLREFVRNNGDMFAPDDVVYMYKARGKTTSCRAMQGLQSLSFRNTRPEGSWKGWTICHPTEMAINNGEDLLGRDK